MGAMTLPLPYPSRTWDRTLPKPPALLQHDPREVSISARSLSMLHHPISAFQIPTSLDIPRRSTVPCIEYQQTTTVPKLLEAARISPRLTSSVNDPESDVKGKRRHSQMACEVDSGEQSPTTSSPSATESASQYCLCQRDPKIPRPRNAFILFRQHQQAAVVAQNRGLANPEISKIIGEQWRALPIKAKDEWKALAEEEKARHQQRYPEYRYQPRRNGRYSNQSSVSGPSSANCPKCGGKTMNPPYTPFTPMTPGSQQQHQRQQQHIIQLQSIQPVQYATQTQGRPQVVQAIISPQSGRMRPYAEFMNQAPIDPRVRYAPTHGPPPPPSPMMLDSPDPKRRRFNGQGILVPLDGVNATIYQEQQQYQQTPQTASFTRPDMRRTNMAPPPRTTTTYISAQHPTTAPPNFQLQPVRAQHPSRMRRDPSLTLPPLQTTAASPNHTRTRSNTAPQVMAASSGKSSLEAMIHSIPIQTKIKILSQISPPLFANSQYASAFQPSSKRGFIVAIEGHDSQAVSSMTLVLAAQLRSLHHNTNSSGAQHRAFAVRVFNGPTLSTRSCFDNKTPTEEGDLSFEQLLEVIRGWHKVSKDMAEYITSTPRPSSSSSSSMNEDHEMAAEAAAPHKVVPDTNVPVSKLLLTNGGDTDTAMADAHSVAVRPRPSAFDATTTDGRASTGNTPNVTAPPTPQGPFSTSFSSSFPSNHRVPPPAKPTTDSPPLSSSEISPRTLPSQTQTHHHQSHPTNPPSHTTTTTIPTTIPTTTASPNQSQSSSPSTIPIALVPTYQLSTADRAALRLGIADAYSPVNHWQWLASLWRGCAGPDVSVVVTGGVGAVVGSATVEGRRGMAGAVGEGASKLEECVEGRGDGGGGGAGAGAEKTARRNQMTTAVEGTAAADASDLNPPFTTTSTTTSSSTATATVDVHLPPRTSPPRAGVATAHNNGILATSGAGNADGGGGGDPAHILVHLGEEVRDGAELVGSEGWARATRRVGFEVAEFLRR